MNCTSFNLITSQTEVQFSWLKLSKNVLLMQFYVLRNLLMESFDFPVDCYAKCCGPCGKQSLHLFALFFCPPPSLLLKKDKDYIFYRLSWVFLFVFLYSNFFYALCEWSDLLEKKSIVCILLDYIFGLCMVFFFFFFLPIGTNIVA